MAVDSLTYGFLYALGFGTLVGSILILVFAVLRKKVPDVYYHRKLLNTWKSYDDYNGKRVGLTEPAPGESFFGWVGPLLATTDDQILKKVGPDAVIFLRFLRSSMLIVVIMAFFGVVILMPVYGTAGNSKLDNGSELFVEGIRVISLGNVGVDETSRLWATVVIEYIATFVIMFFMVKDYSYYTDLRRKYKSSETPANYALAVFDIPPEFRDEVAIRQHFEVVVPGQVADVIMIRRCSKALKLQKQLDTAVMKRELAEYIKEVKGVSPETRPGFCGCCMCHKPKVDAVEYWESEQNRLANEIEDEGSNSKQCPSAILLLSNKRAASILSQANIATNATEWTLDPAPEPNAVNWAAFNVPGSQAELRAFLVAVFVVVFTFTWTIPATFIVGLFNLESLTGLAAFSWLDFILDWPDAVKGLIEGVLPPLVMSVLISLIPTLFRFVVGNERLVSRAVIERKTRDYFYFFTIYGSFFVIVLGEALLDDLDTIIDRPRFLIDQLANKVPSSGVFFATFILLQCLIPLPLLMSGIVRVILRCIFLKLAKTERQKRKARSSGNLFQYFRYSGQTMLILFLCIMFSSLSPIVLVAGVIYFSLAILVFKYQILYATYQPWDGGGFLFTGSFWGTVIGMLIKQLVVVAILGLKEAPAQAIVAFIPFVLALLFSLLVKRRFAAVSECGSLHDLYKESSKTNDIPVRYLSVFEQPAGRKTEYENLNGVEDSYTDVYSDVSYDNDDPQDGLHSEHHDENVGYVPDRAAGRSEV